MWREDEHIQLIASDRSKVITNTEEPRPKSMHPSEARYCSRLLSNRVLFAHKKSGRFQRLRNPEVENTCLAEKAGFPAKSSTCRNRGRAVRSVPWSQKKHVIDV